MDSLFIKKGKLVITNRNVFAVEPPKGVLLVSVDGRGSIVEMAAEAAMACIDAEYGLPGAQDNIVLVHDLDSHWAETFPALLEIKDGKASTRGFDTFQAIIEANGYLPKLEVISKKDADLILAPVKPLGKYTGVMAKGIRLLRDDQTVWAQSQNSRVIPLQAGELEKYFRNPDGSKIDSETLPQVDRSKIIDLLAQGTWKLPAFPQ